MLLLACLCAFGVAVTHQITAKPENPTGIWKVGSNITFYQEYNETLEKGFAFTWMLSFPNGANTTLLEAHGTANISEESHPPNATCRHWYRYSPPLVQASVTLCPLGKEYDGASIRFFGISGHLYELSSYQLRVMEGCPPARYGTFCTENCTCSSSGTCNHVNGCVCGDNNIENFACDIRNLSVTSERREYRWSAKDQVELNMTVQVNAYPSDVNVSVVILLRLHENHSPGGVYRFQAVSAKYPEIKAEAAVTVVFEACPQGRYGNYCSSACECSTGASCHHMRGCVCEEETNVTRFACNLRDLRLTPVSNSYTGTLDFDDEITLALTVNALEKDVNVSILTPQGRRVQLKPPKDGKYEYTAKVDETLTSEGTYTFTAVAIKYPAITVEANISVTLEVPAKVTAKWPQNSDGRTIVQAGTKNFSVECIGTGKPIPHLTWYLPSINNPLQKAYPSMIYQERYTNITILHFRPGKGIRKSDTGNYVCRVYNSVKKGTLSVVETATLQLVVQDGTEETQSEKLETKLNAAVIGLSVTVAILAIAFACYVAYNIVKERKGTPASPGKVPVRGLRHDLPSHDPTYEAPISFADQYENTAIGRSY